MKTTLRTLRKIVREELTRVHEVDTDPSNNPGRPEDPYEYLGMRPRPEMAMAHPSLGGGGADAGGDASGSVGPEGGGEDVIASPDADVEPTEKA